MHLLITYFLASTKAPKAFLNEEAHPKFIEPDTLSLASFQTVSQVRSKARAGYTIGTG
jgi:hypothetical protein